MPYGVIANTLLITAILIVAAVFIRRLPETVEMEKQEAFLKEQKKIKINSSWWQKIITLAGFWAKRFWLFILEAKDLKPSANVSYKIKKIFKKKSQPKALEIPATVKPQENTNHNLSESYYLKAIEKNPKDFSAYLGLGKFYLDEKRYAEAKDVFEFLISKEPGNANHYAKLGYCAYKLGSFEDAVTSYEKSLALDSAQPNRYYNLGLALEAQNKFDEGIIALKKAISLEQNHKYQMALRNLETKAGSSRKET